MKTTRLRHLLGWSLAACLATGGIAFAQGQTMPGAPPPSAQPAPPAARISHAHKVSTSATIVAIDRRDRVLTLRTDQGNDFTVDVPPSVTRFDALKKGDRVHIDYYESIALSLKKGIGPTGAGETTTVQRKGGMLPGGIAARRITATAKVVNVDRARNTVTVQGPSGEVQTIDVTRPEQQQQLANLHAGDRIQLSYIQAVAIDVTPGPGARPPGAGEPGAQPPGAE